MLFRLFGNDEGVVPIYIHLAAAHSFCKPDSFTRKLLFRCGVVMSAPPRQWPYSRPHNSINSCACPFVTTTSTDIRGLIGQSFSSRYRADSTVLDYASAGGTVSTQTNAGRTLGARTVCLNSDLVVGARRMNGATDGTTHRRRLHRRPLAGHWSPSSSHEVFLA
jgi:hypothetical protein